MLPFTIPHSRQVLLRGWLLLAVTSLALAGIFAIFLVISRIPAMEEFLPWPTSFFQKGLVAHVVLSFGVWFLSVFGGLSQIGNQREATLIEKIGLMFATIGTILLLIPALLDRGEPTLNNYIPIIIDPLYYCGLLLLATGVLFTLFFDYIKESFGPGLRGAALIYLLALIAFAASAYQLGNQSLDYDYNERLMWGGGHLLQCLNVMLILIAWSHLSQSLEFNWLFTFAITWLIVTSLVGLSFYVIWDIMDEAQSRAFTHLQKALGPPAVVFCILILPNLKKHVLKSGYFDPANLSLITSIILFFFSCTLGIFVDGQDTRTPAHYHGVIAGINLAFVGLFYSVFLPILGRKIPAGKLTSTQIILYAVGQLLFVLGMFIAGEMGAARKVVGTAIDMNSSIAVLAAHVRDFGGGLAILGGVLFIFIALNALLKKTTQEKEN